MAAGYRKFSRYDLVDLCSELIAEPWNPEALLDWLRDRRIAREELMESILVAGRAQITALFNNWSYKPDLADSAIKLYREMLNHPRFKEGAVSYLWANVHANHQEWLGAFCKRMDARALCTLLVVNPTNHARKSAWTPFDEVVGRHVPIEMREAVIELAAKRRQLAKLYRNTAWPECRKPSQGAERDSMIATDLGI